MSQSSQVEVVGETEELQRCPFCEHTSVHAAAMLMHIKEKHSSQ